MPTPRPGPRGAAAAPLPDVLQFMQLLWALVHGLDKTSKRMTAEIGVTGPQRLVLRVVGLFPGMSAGDLAAILHVHPSTLTGVLQRLVAQKLLLRLGDPDDRRRAILRLSERGARVNGVSRGTIESAVAQVLQVTSARDRAAAARVLERLATRLGAMSYTLRQDRTAWQPLPISTSRRPSGTRSPARSNGAAPSPSSRTRTPARRR